MSIQIDPEFRALIPPLSDDERAQLEANLRAEGCRDPLVVWNSLLLDGHHRFEICTAHQIPYQTVEVACVNRDEAKIWIIRHQFGRRNLEPYQRAELVFVLEPLLAAQAEIRNRNNRLSNLKQQVESPAASKEATGGRTRKNLAKIAGISTMAMQRALAVKNHGSSELQGQVRRGEVTLTKAATECWAGRREAIVNPEQSRHPRRSSSTPTTKRRTPRTESAFMEAVAELLDEFRHRRKANNDDLDTRKWIPHGINVIRQTKISNWFDSELTALIDRWRALSSSTDPRSGDKNNGHSQTDRTTH